MFQMKEQDKIKPGDLSKTEISNMSDTEFKVMIIKILTGLQERMEDMTRALDKEIKNNSNKEEELNNEIKR